MARLMLKGATLIESVVAAVIFLVVFAISLDVVTRVSVVRGDDDYLIVEVDNAVDMAMARYGSGLYDEGEYVDEFSWGVVVTSIEQYRGYGSILEIMVNAEITDSHRRISSRRLIELPERL